jgi:pyruvate ferredoxin oxidoreductase gamma subunit
LLEIRIHGRGGQGSVVAAYLLATAAHVHGLEAQAFPAFGAERRGAPVAAFVRIAERPIRRRCQVVAPRFVIVQDPGLVRAVAVAEGLAPGGGVLVDGAAAPPGLDVPTGARLAAVPATRLALEVLERPLPNVALLGAFLALTAVLPAEALQAALAERFEGEVLERNRTLADRAAGHVEAGAWKDAWQEGAGHAR